MTSADGPGQGPGLHVVQRVVFPAADLDVVPLYVETNLERGAGLAQRHAADERSGQGSDALAGLFASAAVGESVSSIRFGVSLPARPDVALDPRRSAVIVEDRRVSFGTYFNAFPASYWRRWTSVDSVTLRVRLAGQATVVLYRSTATGDSHAVEAIKVDLDEPGWIERALPLTQFIDGGWYWFDIVAGSAGTTLVEAEWAVPAQTTPAGRISIGMTTFNRPGFVVDQLRTLSDAAPVLDLLDAVYLVDQGTSRAMDHPDFADAAKGLGDRLQMIRQGNLGGSGGFSRAMDETLRAGESDYVLLLDDDISLEPEGVLRAVAFADLARRPTIVGGHMFSLHDRSVLNAFGETIAPYRWWWGPAPRTSRHHDFGRQGLRHTPWLHRRVDVDYNGWWMCLIPTRIIEQVGLALPVFIKWDDAEYGLRAGAAGYPTVSMPGVAAWHVPWQDKNDALDWQAYYHLRNRVVSALLHSPYDRGGRLVAESAEIQLQHLLSMQYSSAALRLLAIEDVLSGPEHLHRELATKMRDLRELRLRFSDARAAADIEKFPPVRRRKPPARGKDITSPTSQVGLLAKAARAAARQLTPAGQAASRRPLAALPYQDASWWRLSNTDSALVSAADGASTAWYQRDPRLFRSLSRRSLVLHARLLREWPRLSAEYRGAADRFTSPRAWRETFEASAGDSRARS